MAKKKDELIIRSSAAEYLTYVAAVGESTDSIEMRYEDENIWLTQKKMAVLYDVDVRTINEHIQKIYSDGELTKEATIREFRTVQNEGSRRVNRQIIHYNLQMIISVGFKVKNDRAARFRKWSGQIVKDYTIQGWTMDKERLKKGHMFTDEYFERQLQNIREIRLSFIRKLRICMRLPLIMIKMQRLPGLFFRLYRTRCTGLFTDIQQRN